MVNAKKALMHYGLSLVAPFVSPKLSELPEPDPVFIQYEKVICGDPQTPENSLSSILSQVHLPERDAADFYYLQPGKLALQESAFMPEPEPPSRSPGVLAVDYKALSDFSGQGDFTRFYYMFLRTAWSLPSALGMKGVSLFDQWKTIAAMVFASGVDALTAPSDQFLLVGGDIPGIQNFVYTITSKGATKGLRGRSFFIQLLGQAMVQHMLAAWQLAETNIIYAAGGNFMILAPADADVVPIKTKFESVILKYFHGELGLCLAGHPIAAGHLGHDAFSKASRSLKEKIADQKRTRFSALAKSDWEKIFAPQGKPGNQFCAVCQVPLGKDEGKPIYDGNGDSTEKQCEVCATFEDLASAIRKAAFEVRYGAAGRHPSLWQTILYELSGFTYAYPESLSGQVPDSVVLAINDPAFDSAGADGFKFMANTTPEVTAEDITAWEEDNAPEERKPKHGDVRTFSQMASASTGIARLGVLRMDVDSLGQVMVSGLENRNILTISCLSRTLDWFFEGWLNVICQQVEQAASPEGVGDRLYTIYAGGDDLFIVGSWDLMPLLAHRIHAAFQAYSGFNPSLTISAGIVLEPSKYPLYQAAGDAGEAEEASKAHLCVDSGRTIPKNAFTFLGQTFPWSAYAEIEAKKSRIAHISQDENKALIRILLNIYQQYLEKVEEEETPLGTIQEKLPYGAWMWRSIYALTRFASRVGSKEDIKEEILTMQKQIQKTPHHFGLAARWAELFVRKEAQ